MAAEGNGLGRESASNFDPDYLNSFEGLPGRLAFGALAALQIGSAR
jgi:hypothetical protein